MNNRWTNTATYTRKPVALTLPGRLAAIASEEVGTAPCRFVAEAEINEMIETGKFTNLMLDVIFRVAASRYLTTSQIVAYLAAADIEQDAGQVAEAVKKLCSLHVLRRVPLYSGKHQTLQAYALDVFGVAVCKGFGSDAPYLHSGLYRSKAYRIAKGEPLTDPAYKIRAVLQANNFAIRAIAAGCAGRSFEFGRCLYFSGDAAADGFLFRPTLLLTYDAASSLCIEVSRRGDKNWAESAADKFRRYAAMASRPDFGTRLADKSLSAPPAFVFCAEDFAHAVSLRRAVDGVVKRYGIEPLFITDRESAEMPMKLYTLSLLGEKTCYELCTSEEMIA